MRDFAEQLHPEIEVSGLRIERDGKRLLDIDRLVLNGPGPLMILGPNGAGKSLLLRCLHGLIQPDGGVVRQDGREMCPADRQQQAMVFQRPVLLRRSVAGNLNFVLRRQGFDRHLRGPRVAELLAEGGLDGKARQPALSLSGGEAQRLAILRALATEPELLFLDEPTSALDPQATQAIEALIAAAGRRGVWIIMVTHDIGQARRLGQDILLMQGGKVAEQAEAPAFFTNPESQAARRFLSGGLVI